MAIEMRLPRSVCRMGNPLHSAELSVEIAETKRLATQRFEICWRNAMRPAARGTILRRSLSSATTTRPNTSTRRHPVRMTVTKH